MGWTGSPSDNARAWWLHGCGYIAPEPLFSPGPCPRCVLGATHGARHWWAGLALAAAAAEATRVAASRIRTMEVLPGMYSETFRQGYQRGLADAHCEVLLANARGWRAR